MSEPLLHVLVINWNGREHLRDCFDSLLTSHYENARFVLVDNGSTDGSAAFVREQYGHDPRVEILELPKNHGWSGGNNAGMRRALDAGAEYVFLLNNDTRVAPDVFEKTVALAESHPEIGVVAPKMVLFGQPFVINSVGLLCSRAGASWDLGAGRLDSPQWDRLEPVIGACGGACLIRTEALRKTGLLPEAFVIYLDDLDLCLRVWDAGYEVRPCPDAAVEHKFSASMGEGGRARYKYYLATRNRFLVVLRNFPLLRIAQCLPWIVLAELKSLGRAALDGLWWRIGAHFRAWASALVNLPGALRWRRERKKQGLSMGRFWPMIHREHLFCPGVELPCDGWYAPCSVEGHSLRPMSSTAWTDTAGGQLRVFHANCYPHLGLTRVRVEARGETLAVLSTLGVDAVLLEVPPGRILFFAERIFGPEETGALTEFGGWVSVQPE
jgi:GT2 family glycosyltransferase